MTETAGERIDFPEGGLIDFREGDSRGHRHLFRGDKHMGQ
jgi:hypothetical protein